MGSVTLERSYREDPVRLALHAPPAALPRIEEAPAAAEKEERRWPRILA
jgi:hypothetical protein